MVKVKCCVVGRGGVAGSCQRCQLFNSTFLISACLFDRHTARRRCDLLIVMGTSLVVFPFAGLLCECCVEIATKNGQPLTDL